MKRIIVIYCFSLLFYSGTLHAQLRAGFKFGVSSVNLSSDIIDLKGVSDLNDLKLNVAKANYGIKIIRSWTVQDWCLYNQEYSQNAKADIIVDDRRVADPLERPCVYRHLKDGGDGWMRYTQILYLKNSIVPSQAKLPNEVKTAEPDVNPDFESGQHSNFIRNERVENLILYPNRPNPFSEETIISYSLPFQAPARMEIRDLNSKLIFGKNLPGRAGISSVKLDRKDLPAPGLYFYSLYQGHALKTLKMLVINL